MSPTISMFLVRPPRWSKFADIVVTILKIPEWPTNMRVLLITPKFVQNPGDFYEFPLGLCYISSCLKRAGYEVHGLNLNHVSCSPAEAISTAVRGGGYDVVGTGGLSHHFRMVRDILSAVRKTDPRIFIMAGGGLVSSEPELTCEALELDAGVIGEGEITAVELVRALESGRSLDEVPGIVHRNGGNCRKTAERPSLEDLETLPWPDYELFEVRRYLDNQKPNDNYYTALFDEPRILPVIASRSCPFNCTFCYHPMGRKYRTRPISSVLEELRLYKQKYMLNAVSLLDESFSMDRERVEEFCEGMADMGLKWIAQLRVDRIDRTLLNRMRESGLYYVSYGVESASQAILNSMRKHTSVEQIDTALSLTAKERIGIQGNLLFGDPAETLDTARESFSWARRNSRYGLNMNYVIPYPGSAIYEYGLSKGVISDKLAYLEAGCPTVNLTGMDGEDLLQLRDEMMRTQAETRLWSLDASVRPMKDGETLVEFSVLCPHCGYHNRYRNFRVNSIAAAKLACRNCMQRFDYRTSIFPENDALLKRMRAGIEECARRQTRVSIAPSMADPTFEDYLGFLGLSPRDLDIHFVFDGRPELHGRLQFGTVPIVPYAMEHMEQAAEDAFLILPCPNHEGLVRDLMEKYSVPEERIIHLHRSSNHSSGGADWK